MQKSRLRHYFVLAFVPALFIFAGSFSSAQALICEQALRMDSPPLLEALHSSDPYEVLGISKQASQAEVRSAYIQWAKYFREGTLGSNPKATEFLQKVNEAYRLVSKSKKDSPEKPSPSTASQDSSETSTRAELKASPVPINPYQKAKNQKQGPLGQILDIKLSPNYGSQEPK